MSQSLNPWDWNLKDTTPGPMTRKTRIYSWPQHRCVAKRRGYVLRNASLPISSLCVMCTYTNLDSIAYYTPRLYGIALRVLLPGYKAVQHVTVLNIVGNCNTMLLYYINYIILYYIILYYIILYIG